MIDELNLELLFKPPLPVVKQSIRPFPINDLMFFPQWNESGFLSYNAQLENLRLKIFGDRLFINNSWQKYYLGNNYSDFHRSEIELTLLKLQNAVGENLEKARVKKIAYGCVIRVDPYLNFPNWIIYKTKHPFPMNSNGKQYGAYFDFTDFRFKGYDKTFEAWKHNKQRIESNYFRIECVVKYMRHLKNRKDSIVINGPTDLYKPEILEVLKLDLIKKHHTIVKKPIMNLDGLSTSELNILASMQNKEIREVLRKKHKRTYLRYKSLFEELTKESNSNYYDGIEFLLDSKLTTLINN
jgi:hypothetical protein